MPRYRLLVAYEGTDFHGWQKQLPADPSGGAFLRTVQGVLEDAVRAVVREPVDVVGASRTDAGVHARGQVAAFSTESGIPTERLAAAINSHLPPDVQIRRAEAVHDEFSPISDAISKGYRYRLAHGIASGAFRPLFDRRTTAWCAYALDPDAMHRAARHLIGERDFASFTRLHHGRESTVRSIYDCTVTPISDHRLRMDVIGNGFLYNMVRIIAGTLMEVGRGRIDADAIPDIIAGLDRRRAGPTMPPEGLCLMWVRYERGRGGDKVMGDRVTR